MNASLFVYPSPTCWGTSGLFQFWVIGKKLLWIISNWGLLYVKLLYIFVYKSSCGHMFSLHLCKYWGVECLGHMFSFLRNYQTVFSKLLNHITFLPGIYENSS